MLLQLTSIKGDITSALKNTKATILPFIEEPSTDRVQADNSQLNASQLFSLFTASIIQEDVIFSR